MKSRERVLAAIRHQQPDQVPVDMGATPSSGISAIAYSNLVKHLGLNLPTRIYDVVQQLAQPDMEIINRFGIDVLDIGRMFNDKDEDWYPITMANGDTAYYPVWFKPVLQPDGSYVTYDTDGTTKLAHMPIVLFASKGLTVSAILLGELIAAIAAGLALNFGAVI